MSQPNIIEQIAVADRDPDGFRYGWIRSVTDDSGAATDRAPRDRLLRTTVTTGRTLEPGDRVVFHCEGSDPYGRELRWWLHPFGGDRQPQVRGDRVELTWIVGPGSVGDRVYVGIGMAADSHYHREGGPREQGYDGWVVFYYRVRPAVALWQSSRGQSSSGQSGHGQSSRGTGTWRAIKVGASPDQEHRRHVRPIGRCHDQS